MVAFLYILRPLTAVESVRCRKLSGHNVVEAKGFKSTA